MEHPEEKPKKRLTKYNSPEHMAHLRELQKAKREAQKAQKTQEKLDLIKSNSEPPPPEPIKVPEPVKAPEPIIEKVKKEKKKKVVEVIEEIEAYDSSSSEEEVVVKRVIKKIPKKKPEPSYDNDDVYTISNRELLRQQFYEQSRRKLLSELFN